jgi:hypothetical protein
LPLQIRAIDLLLRIDSGDRIKKATGHHTKPV